MVQFVGRGREGVAGAFSREIKASVAPSECLVARYISLLVRFVNISEGRRREAERVSRSRNKLVVRKEEERRRGGGGGDGLKRRCKRNEDESRGRWEARRGFQTRERGRGGGGGWGKAKKKKERKGAFPSLRLPDGSKLFTRL